MSESAKKSTYLASEIEEFFYNFFTTPAVHVQFNRDQLIETCPLPVSARHASPTVALSNFKLGSFVASFLGKTSRTGAKSFREPYQHLMFAATSYSSARIAQGMALELDHECFTIFAHAAATTPLRSLKGRETLRALLSNAIPPPGLESTAPATVGVHGFADIQCGLVQDEIQLDKATDGLTGSKFKAQVLEIYSEAVERAQDDQERKEAEEAVARASEDAGKEAVESGKALAPVADSTAATPARSSQEDSLSKKIEVSKSARRARQAINTASGSKEFRIPKTSPYISRKRTSTSSSSSSTSSKATAPVPLNKQQKVVLETVIV